MTRITKIFLLSCAAATSFAAPTFVHAQQAPAGASTLQEVVVTARKQAENVQAIPVQVNVLTAASLERTSSTGLKDIAAQTPGFSYENYSGGIGAPVIRGQAQTVLTNNVQNVGVYFDGIYLQRSYMVDASLIDIDSVEIVKGPQSALYGRNAFSGAIVYDTRKPAKVFSVDANVTYGSNDRLDYGGSVSIPINSWLGVRFSGEKSSFDGTWPNNHPLANGSGCVTCGNVGGYDNDSYQFSLMAKPIQSLDLNLTYSHTDTNDEAAAGYIIGTSNPGTLNCSPSTPGVVATSRLFCGALPATVTLVPGEGRLPGIVEDPRASGYIGATDLLSLRSEYRFNENWSLNYLFGYAFTNITSVGNSQRNPLTSDLPGYLAPFLPPPLNLLATDVIFDSDPNGYLRTYQNDVRVQYKNDKLRAFLGFNTSQTDDKFLGYISGGVPNTFSPLTSILAYLSRFQHEDSTSVYAFGEYKLTSKLTLSAEGRFSRDVEKFTDFTQPAADWNTPSGYLQSKTFSNFTPRFAADYQLTPDHALYASVAKGVKDGGFNGGPYFFYSKEATTCPTVFNSGGTPTIANCAGALNTAQQSFNSEENWTYEIGSKNEFFDHTLRVNVSAYYVDWTNIQISVAKSDTGTAPGTPVAAITGNVGGATVKGIEVEGAWLPTPKLAINYGLDVHSATYTSGAVGQDFLAAQVCDNIVCSAANASIAGKAVSRSPSNQANLGVQYSDTFAEKYDWFVRADATYQGKQFEDEENLSWVPSRTLVNLRAGVKRGPLDLQFWVKNLGDLRYVASAFVLVGTNGAGTASYTPFLGDLRTFGMTLKAHY
jgi:iron complex outermembrane receptor protein